MAMQLFQRNAEAKLVEALNSVTDPTGWKALHFHFSDLMEQFKSEYQVKIAVNLINDLLKNFDGGVFVLQDSSIIVACYGLEHTLQNKLVFQLRYLYMDDPLAYTDTGQENPNFYHAYDLAADWDMFLDLATRRMALTSRRVSSPRAEKIAQAIAANIDEHEHNTVISISARENLSVSRLAHVERELQHVTLAKVIRRQPVCAVQVGLPVRKVFDELYVHMRHLSDIMQADVDFVSNRWLFRYLTQLLDMRMLSYLKSERDRYLSDPVSINLNVETLMSERFREFDESLSAGSKSGIIIEVPVVDAFADMTGFMIASKEVQKLGYRVCLDGISPDSLNHIRRDKLGVNLIKVQWNANILDLASQKQEMTEAIVANTASRVILCRCDDMKAIEFGQSIGIPLFQGRQVDRMLNPSKESDN